MIDLSSDILLICSSFLLTLFLQKIIPSLFKYVPLSVLAGFILLIISELTFSLKLSTEVYTDIFLAVVFGSFPLSLSKINFGFVKKVLPLWKYSLLQYFLQWGGSLFIVILILKHFFPINDEFGAYLPSGFAGGHGSAAVVGDLLKRGGIKDAMSFTMFCATVGVIFSVLGGVFWSRVFSRKFKLKKISEKRELKVKELALITFIVLISFFSKPFVYEVLAINVPGFVIAVFWGLIFRNIPVEKDSLALSSYSNLATDILVIVGIGSIKIELIRSNSYPLIIIFIFGLTQAIILFKFLAFKVFTKNAFERALFTWGWSIGGLVIGLNLIQSLDSDNSKEIIDEFAMTYLLLSPIEICLLLFAPWLILNNYGLELSFVLLFLAILILFSLLHPRLSLRNH